MFADVNDLDDIRMSQADERLDLAGEPGGEAFLFQNLSMRQFDGDVPTRPYIASEVNGRHPAGAEGRLDPVPAVSPVERDAGEIIDLGRHGALPERIESR